MTDPDAPPTPDFAALYVEHGEALADTDLPMVAVIIVNCDGRTMTAACLSALDACDYPKDKIEILVVDNGSVDGTKPWLDRAWPAVRVIANDHNVGFTPACNQAVAQAGEATVLVFLNNDVRVERPWLRELVSPIARGECATTSSKMLTADGKRIDHAGGGTNFQGVAVSSGYLQVPAPVHDRPRRTLFACGGAMAMDRKAYTAVGGFDDEFFAYYDDLDLGWRTNLAGHEVHYAPLAVCRHDHSGTSRRFPGEQIRLLQTRNALFTCVKNYADDTFDRILPALFAMHVRRTWVYARLTDDSEFRIERTNPRGSGWQARLKRLLKKSAKSYPLDRMAMADFLALNDLLGNWNHWMERRAGTQALRQVPDSELFGLFEKPLWCLEGEQGYIELQDALLERAGLRDVFASLDLGGEIPAG